MSGKADKPKGISTHGYRPAMEGYQPGLQVIAKGFQPAATTPPNPPTSGSSAHKPVSVQAVSATKQP